MPRLLVLAPPDLPGENHGLLVQHITTLEALLGPRGWRVEHTHPLDPALGRRALDADLVLVHMLAGPEVEGVILARRDIGRGTVYEITDNFLGLGEWTPPAHLLRSPLVRQRILYHASIADALQVYAPGLADLFGDVNPRVIRFDPYVPVPAGAPPKPTGLVVGWGGTKTHADDLASIAPTVTALCRRRSDVTFAYMGARAGFDAYFRDVPPGQRLVRPFADHAAYLEFVGGLHVGLAPLRPSAFNAARTDTRVATYAALGVAAVIEDAPIHRAHAGHARIYDSPEALAATLHELADDPSEVRALARRGRDWALRSRSAGVLADQRERAYRPLLADPPAAPAAHVEPDGDADAAYRRLSESGGATPEDAIASATAALEAIPSYEQAHLALTRALERAGRLEAALEHAARALPSPVFADQFAELQTRLARRVRPEQAPQHLARIRSPFLRARLCAGGSTRAILAHQPYDFFALAASIKRLQRADPGSGELDELYARATLVAPEIVPPERRPPRLAPYVPA